MFRPLPLLLFVLMFAGCLEFDAQEITMRYDAEADRIDALVVYRGLYVEKTSGSGNDPFAKAFADLEQAQQHGKFCFWSNWPFAVDPAADKGGPLISLLPHFEAETGGLFTDPEGVLCGYQFVRIREAKAFVAKVNTLLEVAMTAAMANGMNVGGTQRRFSADSRDALREFLRGGGKMLVLEQGRVELRIPCAADDHRWLRSALGEAVLHGAAREALRRPAVAALRKSGGDVTETGGDDATAFDAAELREAMRASATFRFVWDNDVTLEHRADVTTFGLGLPGSDELRVVKASDGLYHPAFLEQLRERGVAIEDGVPAQELARRFAQFREREIVLPPKLAERRGAAK